MWPLPCRMQSALEVGPPATSLCPRRKRTRDLLLDLLLRQWRRLRLVEHWVPQDLLLLHAGILRLVRLSLNNDLFFSLSGFSGSRDGGTVFACPFGCFVQSVGLWWCVCVSELLRCS